MTSTGGPRPELVASADRGRDPRLVRVAAALVVAGILALTVAGAGPRLVRDSLTLAVLGYLAYWIPLVAVSVWALRRGAISDRSAVRAFHPLDLIWGLGAGLIARSAATLVEFAVYGRALVPGSQPTIDGVGPSPVFVAVTLMIAPLLLAPLIEEWFFRGTLLPAIRGRAPGLVPAAVAVIASAAIFALMHLLSVTTVDSALVTGLSSLALGLATGTLAVTTGRLVAPITAHIAFNAAVVIPALL